MTVKTWTVNINICIFHNLMHKKLQLQYSLNIPLNVAPPIGFNKGQRTMETTIHQSICLKTMIVTLHNS